MKSKQNMELPEHVRKGINKSIEQANRGEFIPYDKVKQKATFLLKNKVQNDSCSTNINTNKK